MNLEIIDQTTAIDAPRSWQPDAKVCACFRALYRRMVFQSGLEKPPRVVGVTSCRHGEGVSTVACRLAIAAAEGGEQKVLLVDANPTVLSVDRTFTIDPSDRLVGESQPLDQLLRPSPVENLWTLALATAFPGSPAAEPQRNPQELLTGLSFKFPFIVVDLPPVDELGGELDATAGVDGLVMVVEAECTRRSLARAATVALSHSRLLGAVLNKRQELD